MEEAGACLLVRRDLSLLGRRGWHKVNKTEPRINKPHLGWPFGIQCSLSASTLACCCS